MQLTADILLLLFFVAIIAGWVDAVAGGGGLITVPALLLAGLPPAAAIATNKVQGTFGTFTAALYFFRRGVLSIKENLLPICTVSCGAVLGGLVLTQVSTEYLSFIVPVLLLLTGLYFLLYAKNLDESREPKLSRLGFNASVAPALGFYDGFFGPGMGSFASVAFVTLRGVPIRIATANAKLLNFSSNFAALVYFILFGQIFWLAGVVMIGGQTLGAYLGARTALNAGAKLIRPITVIMCFAMSISSLWRLLFSAN